MGLWNAKCDCPLLSESDAIWLEEVREQLRTVDTSLKIYSQVFSGGGLSHVDVAFWTKGNAHIQEALERLGWRVTGKRMSPSSNRYRTFMKLYR